ncbi:MAG: hypothetical protein K2M04_07320 [Muribaculaceae bacterium]|nr:hypothetical protein [Muribaculaceae bacterium]
MARRKILTGIAVLLVTLVCHGQNEQSDSIRQIMFAADSLSAAKPERTIWDYASLAYFHRLTAEQQLAMQMREGIDFGTLYTPIIPGEVTPLTWKNGGVMVRGGRQSLPGMMGIESGEAGIYHEEGRWSMYAGATVNKYGYFQGLHTQYGVTGSVSYMISPNVTVTAFGTYYFNGAPKMGPGLPLPPSMAGYYGQTKFGGIVDYSINERWGVETGVQMVQPTGMRRIEVEPIVTPYYKLGNGKTKVRIGLPVGQILYHVMRRHVH